MRCRTRRNGSSLKLVDCASTSSALSARPSTTLRMTLLVTLKKDFAGAAGLFLLGAGEAAEAQEATNFGAGRVHHDGGLLSGEPMGGLLRHGAVTLTVSLSRFNSIDPDSYTIC